MMLKRWSQMAVTFVLVGLTMTCATVPAESVQTFRQKNGLLTYEPPDWFLQGYFIARERNPGYVFGPVQAFVKTLNGKTSWLIEDVELERLERGSVDGSKAEYSLYLEALSPEGTEYWVFVVLPHENAQAWFEARRAYHGRKAEGYYGRTQSELETALNQGLRIRAELRFLIEKGETCLLAPEELIMSRYKFQPVFDLTQGRRLSPAVEIK